MNINFFSYKNKEGAIQFYTALFIILFFPVNYLITINLFNEKISFIKSIIFTIALLFLLLLIIVFINLLELRKKRKDKHSPFNILIGVISIELSITTFGIYLFKLDFSQVEIQFIAFIIFIAWMIVPTLLYGDYYKSKNFKNNYENFAHFTYISTFVYISIIVFSIFNFIVFLEKEFIETIIFSVYNLLGASFFIYMLNFSKNSDILVLSSNEKHEEIKANGDKDISNNENNDKTMESNDIDSSITKTDKTNYYHIPSYFLGEINEYFKKAGKSESLCLMAGLINKLNNSYSVYCISKPVMDIQNPSYAKSDQLSLHMELTKFDDFGHSVLILCHRHPWNGPDATNPSSIDKKTQELWEARYPVIHAIYSFDDGYIRFWSLKNEFKIIIEGKGVSEMGNNIYKINL